MILNIVQTDKTLPLPKRASAGAAGYDLRASLEDEWSVAISPGEVKIIPLGIKTSFSSNYEVQLRPRSGLAIKYGITLANSPATIDADYRGELMAGLINLSDKTYRVIHGDRICQMVPAPVLSVDLKIVSSLEDTERGEGGLGSSGSQ